MRNSILFAALILTGCGDSARKAVTSQLPTIDTIVVVNQVDDFTIAAAGINQTSSRSYTWTCTDDQANITFASGLTSGEIRIRISDGNGVQVYDNTYHSIQSGAHITVTRPGGQPGDWTLEFWFTDALWGGAITIEADTLDDPDVIQLAGGYALTSGTNFYAVGWGAGPADVSIVSGLPAGSIRVRIWDDAGTLVYDTTVVGPLTIPVNDPTAAGTAGIWTIQIDYSTVLDGSAILLSHP